MEDDLKKVKMLVYLKVSKCKKNNKKQPNPTQYNTREFKGCNKAPGNIVRTFQDQTIWSIQ